MTRSWFQRDALLWWTNPLLSFSLFLFFKRMSDAVMLSGSIWSACRKVSMVFGILHHCVKSIKSYTKEIGSLPPLTFTVRWLIGFCFVANYKTHSSFPTCPLSRGKTIKSHNWAKIVFQLILNVTCPIELFCIHNWETIFFKIVAK